eukprot:scaffold22743_cov28-Tisochrysis_lutea.AAC.3
MPIGMIASTCRPQAWVASRVGSGVSPGAQPSQPRCANVAALSPCLRAPCSVRQAAAQRTPALRSQ